MAVKFYVPEVSVIQIQIMYIYHLAAPKGWLQDILSRSTLLNKLEHISESLVITCQKICFIVDKLLCNTLNMEKKHLRYVYEYHIIFTHVTSVKKKYIF